MKIVIVGHVDHGKSTLVGRLFYETDSLPEGKYEQIKATCERRGVPFEWAFLMDAFQAERDQNITIDTSQIWFKTPKRPYVIIDAPGHREFIKNMVTGAANADAALLLIAANEGVQEQSRRHGYLLSLLGVKQVAVVVNKMDTVAFKKETFAQIEEEYRAFLSQIGVEPSCFIPISARDGDNLNARSPKSPWYDGPTIVQALDHFEEPGRDTRQALRFPVQDIYRFDDRRIIAGRIESGRIEVGDELLFTPGARRARVRTIERWSSPQRQEAEAGESIGITLNEQIFVERGQLASHPEDAPRQTDRIKANLFWLGENPVKQGNTYKLKLGSQETLCRVERVLRVIDASTLVASPGGASSQVGKNDAAEIVLRTLAPLGVDVYGEQIATARFVLVDGWDVRGGGIVTETLDASEEAYDKEALASVTPVERFKRNRHRGAVVALSGGQDAVTQHELVMEIERALFNRGMQTYTLAPHHLDLERAELDAESQALVARNLAEAGVVCLLDASLTHGLDGGQSDLGRLRAVIDHSATPFVVLHLGALQESVARAAKGATGDKEALLGDADVVIPVEGLDSNEQRVAAILEKLVPLLQRF